MTVIKDAKPTNESSAPLVTKITETNAVIRVTSEIKYIFFIFYGYRLEFGNFYHEESGTKKCQERKGKRNHRETYEGQALL